MNNTDKDQGQERKPKNVVLEVHDLTHTVGIKTLKQTPKKRKETEDGKEST